MRGLGGQMLAGLTVTMTLMMMAEPVVGQSRELDLAFSMIGDDVPDGRPCQIRANRNPGMLVLFERNITDDLTLVP